jgi:hypothetical protein
MLQTSLLHVPGLEKTSLSFRRKLIQMCARLGMVPDYLVAVMSFESARSFRPDIRNPLSNATGLIQFMPSTARMLGTSVDQLAAMSAEAQLDWVEKFFLPHKGRLKTAHDHYLAVFMPALIGKSLDHVAARTGSAVYRQNRGFDRTGKGYFTVRDIVAPVLGIIAASEKKPRLPAGLGILPLVTSAFLGGAAGIGLGWSARVLLR